MLETHSALKGPNSARQQVNNYQLGLNSFHFCESRVSVSFGVYTSYAVGNSCLLADSYLLFRLVVKLRTRRLVDRDLAGERESVQIEERTKKRIQRGPNVNYT